MNKPFERKHNKPFARKQNSNWHPLDQLVLEALEFINTHRDNQTIFGCFHKKGDQLETFGVYNSKTKKHSIWYVNNFYPQDLLDLKEVALARK